MAATAVVVEGHAGAEVVVATIETEEADTAIVEAVTAVVIAAVSLNKALACDHRDGIWLDLVNLRRTFILRVR